MEAAKDHIHALSYAPKPARISRKGIRRGLLLSILIAFCVVAWIFGRPYLAQARYLQLQAHVAALSLPHDKVVFETAAGAAAHLRNAQEYRGPRNPYFAVKWTPRPPSDWQPPAHFYLRDFDDWAPMRAGDKQDALAFVHERRSKGGALRTVSLTFGCCEFGPEGFAVAAQANSWLPASWQPGSRAVSEARVSKFFPMDFTPSYKLGIEQSLRVFSGEVDDTNESHFVVRFELSGIKWRLHGWLRDPGTEPRGAKRTGLPWIALSFKLDQPSTTRLSDGDQPSTQPKH